MITVYVCMGMTCIIIVFYANLIAKLNFYSFAIKLHVCTCIVHVLAYMYTYTCTCTLIAGDSVEVMR